MAIISIEQQLSDILAKEIANEIDREVLWNMLKESGWHQVVIDRLTDNNHAIDITFWLEKNIKNRYERNGREFLFSAERDAITFILRWV